MRRIDPAMLALLGRILADASDERLVAIFADRERRYLGHETLASGSPGQVVVRVRLLFTRALAFGACGVILAHNHPSGDCRPSDSDLRTTERLRDVAQALEMELLDHLIFAGGRCYSMASGRYL